MNKLFRTPSFQIYLSEKDPAKQIQLFRTGTFQHDQHGPFQITKEMLSQMKVNFESDVRRIDLAIDFAHRNDDIAAGWIKGLELREEGDELWAEVEWTPAGEKSVSGKEFRYISPEFSFNYQDNENLKKFGPVLLGAGLTNRPVIKEMEPVIELQEKQVNSQGGKPMSEEGKEGVETVAVELADMKKQLEAVKADLAAMQTKVVVVEGERDSLKQEAQLAEKKKTFSLLLSEGKACPAQEKAFLAGDMAEYVSLAEPINLTVKGTAEVPEEKKEEGSVDDKVIVLAEKYISENKAKNINEAYSLVFRDHPELKQEKYK